MMDDRHSPESDRETLSERTAALLERDILAGVLQPGEKLAIAQLASLYGISQTPLREAMTFLAARGLVRAIGQRGFRVAQVSRADLEDITRLRVLVETEALRISIEHGGDEWEAEIIASLHRFRRAIERVGESFREGAQDIDMVHKAFHTALIAGCGSPRLLHLHSDLYDQAYRYRRLGMARMPPVASFIGEHESLAQIVLSRDFAVAKDALSAHLASTLDFAYDAPEARLPCRTGLSGKR